MRHLPVLAVSFLECFPLDHIAELKHCHIYGGLPKRLKAMVVYLKTSTNEKMYSDYLHAAPEAEKEEAMEPSCSQTVATTSKPLAMSFFPLWTLKGSQPTKPPLCRQHILRKRMLTRRSELTAEIQMAWRV